MKRIIEWAATEPAMVVALVLAVANLAFDINAEQALHLSAIVESVILLLGGGVVRSQVTPVAKLQP